MYQKYFIALVPPEPLLSNVKKLKETIYATHGIKGALRSPAHITLHMPFRFNNEKETQLLLSLQAFTFDQNFEIELKNFKCFEPRVIFISVVENEILNRLQKKLVKHCKQQLQLFNQFDDKRGFHPHITIAFRDLKKKQFYSVWESFKNEAFDDSFKCKGFYLLKQIHNHWEVYKEFNF